MATEQQGTNPGGTEPRGAAGETTRRTVPAGGVEPMSPNSATAAAAEGATRQAAGGTGAAAQEGASEDNLRRQIQQSVDEGIQSVQRVANEYYQKLNDQAGRYYEDGQRYVREYPGGSVMGAFAFGVLLGVLIRRL